MFNSDVFTCCANECIDINTTRKSLLRYSKKIMRYVRMCWLDLSHMTWKQRIVHNKYSMYQRSSFEFRCKLGGVHKGANAISLHVDSSIECTEKASGFMSPGIMCSTSTSVWYAGNILIRPINQVHYHLLHYGQWSCSIARKSAQSKQNSVILIPTLGYLYYEYQMRDIHIYTGSALFPFHQSGSGIPGIIGNRFY